jgi:hypothetical protein
MTSPLSGRQAARQHRRTPAGGPPHKAYLSPVAPRRAVAAGIGALQAADQYGCWCSHNPAPPGASAATTPTSRTIRHRSTPPASHTGAHTCGAPAHAARHVRTCVPVTSEGHLYAQFQRALKTGNAHLALAAAAELRYVDLADALSLVLLIRAGDPLRYERAAVRWLSRYTAEDRELRLAEACELVELLAAGRPARPGRAAAARAVPARPRLPGGRRSRGVRASSIPGNHNQRAAHFWRSVSTTSIQLNRQFPPTL